MKCAETVFYGHGFTALAGFGFGSAAFVHVSSDLLYGQATGKPCHLVLQAQSAPAFLFALPTPIRNVNVVSRLPEAIAVQGAFHFGGNFFLRRKAKERLFILGKAGTVCREE